jgi:hypothetical protein
VTRKIVLPLFAIGLAILCAPTTSEAAKPAAKKTATKPKAAPAKGPAKGPTKTASSPASQPSAGSDWSLEEKEHWVKLEEELKGYADSAGKKCGVKIVAGFDKESFRGHLTEGGTYGLSGYARAHCQAGLSAIDDLCNSSEIAKASIAKKVSTVQCKWGGAGKSSIDLNGSKLTTTIDMDGDNASTHTGKVSDFLKKKL